MGHAPPDSYAPSRPWPPGTRRLGDVLRDAYCTGTIDVGTLDALLGMAFALGQHERAIACHNRPALAEALRVLRS